MERRPAGVAFLAGLFVIFGVALFALAVSMPLDEPLRRAIAEQGFAGAAEPLHWLVLGLSLGIGGAGLWRGERWAWWGATTVCILLGAWSIGTLAHFDILNAAGDSVDWLRLYTTGSALVFTILVFLYLLSHEALDYLGADESDGWKAILLEGAAAWVLLFWMQIPLI